jgi:cold shock CspA family protein
MRKKGKLRSWNDQKGFGFIDPVDGGKEVFLHISAFSNRNRRPDIGQYVTYTLSADKQGRPRAANATLPGDRARVKAKQSGGTGAVIGAGLFLVVVGLSVVLTELPPWVLGLYLAASAFTFIMYAVDKSAAKSGASIFQ